MTTTFLSLWLPHLPTDRIERLGGMPDKRDGSVAPPLVTVAKIKGAQRVVAVNQAAAARSIRPGMTLADARAIQPDLGVGQADQVAEADALGRIADWCGRFTPLVALDGLDGLVLDIGGAAHLFGGEAGLMEAIETGMAAQGFCGCAAVAATPEAAWALARFGQAGAPRLAPDPQDTKAFWRLFGPLRLAALRLEPSLVQALAQAGLRHIGDLLWRPRAPLAARFGDGLLTRLDALAGLHRTPISPRFDPPVFMAEQRFASPIVLRDDVERTLLALAGHLGILLERQNKGARQIEACLFRVDGVVRRIVVGSSRPLTRPDQMGRLFRERIEAVGEDGLDTGYGFDVVRLAVRVAEPLGHRQDDLVPATGTDHPSREEDLADLVDRLGARLGLRRVTRLMEQDTHIPEFAVTAVPAVRGIAPVRSRTPDPDHPPRPIRMFERPEPIDTIAAVPDGPPMRFRWRRATHEIAAIEGPERIAPEWWKATGPELTRDYFRAEDQDGRRFWLFREGLFPTGTGVGETTRPRWFLHGLFG